MTNQKTALVLGATGGSGGEVARLLHKKGWTVRALHRHAEKQPRDTGFTWIKGDAMSKHDVVAAAEGASVIVHAVNPPGYRNWGELVLPMLDNTIAAAAAVGARIVLPGTVYNFGPDTLPDPREDSPHHPLTRKGGIRAEMERRLRVAADGGTPVIIVRAGDFFGPQASNNWFSMGVVQAGKPVKAITYPGRRGIGHQWAYLPDVAETMVRLIEKGDALDRFAVFHMEGHWDADGTEMIAAIRRAVGRPSLKVKKFPWTIAWLLSPFVTLFREMQEMRYLWKTPVHLRNDRLVAVLGSEPHTPLPEAVRATLAGIGCLGAFPAKVDATFAVRKRDQQGVGGRSAFP